MKRLLRFWPWLFIERIESSSFTTVEGQDESHVAIVVNLDQRGKRKLVWKPRWRGSGWWRGF